MIRNLLNKSTVLILLILSLTSVHAQKSKSLPPEQQIKKYVTDLTGTLSSIEISTIETKLSGFDKETSNQVVVYMMGTLGGESLEETSIEIAEKNGIGQKSKNNGVLLFIVKDDRKLRIEVGYGLEGALPDALCGQIIRKEITPYFKQGKFYEGINAGVDAIIKATRGEYTQDKKTTGDKDNGFAWTICGLPFLIFFIFLFIFGSIIISFVRRIFGFGRRSSGFFGGWGTGSSSSSWSSGSSSFGGFSGGGGSFGGGGASGSW
jgi:uncharacterized protein